MYDILAEGCGLTAGSRILEIGPGPGQATVELLARGATVTAVEPGVDLARVLTERTAGLPLTVITGRFEDVAVADAAFDLVVSATAFHWVDPAVGLPKVAAALVPGGWVALWWAVFGDADRLDPFRDALEAVLAEKAPHLVDDGAAATKLLEEDNQWRGWLAGTPGLDAVDTRIVRYEGRHTPEQLRAMFATFSGWITLPEPLRTELLDDVARLARDEFGGLVVRPYLTAMYLARKGDSGG